MILVTLLKQSSSQPNQTFQTIINLSKRKHQNRGQCFMFGSLKELEMEFESLTHQTIYGSLSIQCCNYIIPITIEHMIPNEESYTIFQIMHVFIFYNVVLLRPLRANNLMKDAISIKVSLKFIINTFLTIIRLENQNLNRKKSLNHIIKQLKDVKHIMFMFHQIKHGHTCLIINQYPTFITYITYI